MVSQKKGRESFQRKISFLSPGRQSSAKLGERREFAR
jgi:hypothetical protein